MQTEYSRFSVRTSIGVLGSVRADTQDPVSIDEHIFKFVAFLWQKIWYELYPDVSENLVG